MKNFEWMKSVTLRKIKYHKRLWKRDLNDNKEYYYFYYLLNIIRM
jgi:hypothetical protein